MNRSEIFYYAWRIFTRKDSVLTIILLSMSFGLLIKSSMIICDMCLEMKQPVECHIVMSSENVSVLDEIGKEGYFLDMSQYRKNAGILIFHGYETQVMFVGMEKEYLERKYGSILPYSMEATMPYLILDVSVLEAMKNDKNESMKVVEAEDYVLQIFETNGGKKAKVCAVIDSDERMMQSIEEAQMYVYTTLEGFEMLSSENRYTGGMTDHLEGESGSVEYQNVSELKDEINYFVKLKNGFYLQKMIKSLEKYDISLFEEDSDNALLKMDMWGKKAEKGKIYICLSLVMLVCTVIVSHYQRLVWDQRHCDFWNYFCQYDFNGKNRHRIWRQHHLILSLFGIAGGLILCFGSELLGVFDL